MGKTIELELSDALYAQVSTEAEACGQGLFGYIRAKLATRGEPPRRPDVIREHDQERPSRDAAPTLTPTFRAGEVKPDPGAFAEARISRIEQAIDGLTAFMVSEPLTHCPTTGRGVYSGFAKISYGSVPNQTHRYFRCDATVAQFKLHYVALRKALA